MDLKGTHQNHLQACGGAGVGFEVQVREGETPCNTNISQDWARSDPKCSVRAENTLIFLVMVSSETSWQMNKLMYAKWGQRDIIMERIRTPFPLISLCL